MKKLTENQITLIICKYLILTSLIIAPIKLNAQSLFGKDYDSEIFRNLRNFSIIIDDGLKKIDSTVIVDDSTFIFNFSYKNDKIIYNVFEENKEKIYFLYDKGSNFGYINFSGEIHTFYTDKNLKIIRQTVVSKDKTFNILINYNLDSSEVKNYFFMEPPPNDLINQINIEKEISSLKSFLIKYTIIR